MKDERSKKAESGWRKAVLNKIKEQEFGTGNLLLRSGIGNSIKMKDAPTNASISYRLVGIKSSMI